MREIVLKASRERSILRRHPWIFSGAIREVRGSPIPGETVKIITSRGECLALAAFNPQSQIACRVWTWDIMEEITPVFFEERIKQAILRREQAASLIPSNAFRLVHGESDGVPGLVLDRYDEVLVVQFLSAGVEFWREVVIEVIIKLTGCQTLYERSDVDIRQLEGLGLRTGLLFGKEITQPFPISENGLQFLVDIIHGHKTGYYLDQRDNRYICRKISMEGKRWTVLHIRGVSQ